MRAVQDDAAPWPSASLGILGQNYVESPDGGCATLEYIPEVLEQFLTGVPGTENVFGGNWQASWVANGTPGAPNSSAFGCKDPEACNFNANAILADPTECEFESCVICSEDLDQDGVVGMGDLLNLLQAWGSACE